MTVRNLLSDTSRSVQSCGVQVKPHFMTGEKQSKVLSEVFMFKFFFNRKNEEHFYWFFHVLNCKAKKTRSSLTNVYSVKVCVVVIALYCRNSADLLGKAVKVAWKNRFQVSNKCFVFGICIPHQFVISQEAFVTCHDQTCQKIAKILFPIDEVANFLNKFLLWFMDFQTPVRRLCVWRIMSSTFVLDEVKRLIKISSFLKYSHKFWPSKL